MALLTQSNPYKNPQANILFGSGSKKYKPEEIRNYINTPGRTDDDILGKALAEGVSVDEINKAMGDTPRFSMANMERHLAGKGITRDLAEPLNVPVAAAPPPVKAGTIVVGPKETMAGQMKGLLEDPNNPLNVQARNYGDQLTNKRGLLNSTINATAGLDAMYKNAQPIAAQDASTNYDSKKTNVGNKLTADMFNNDLTGRLNMFNAGTEKDIGINTQNRNMDFAIANMDAGNKLAIAQVQAAANDSGIMGDLGKSFMSLYQQTASDPNMSDALKLETYNTLKSQFENLSSLLPSFESKAKNLSFLSASPAGGTSSGGTPAVGLLNGGSGTEGKGWGESPKLKSGIDRINILGYKPEPHVLAGVAAYERATGAKVDRSLVAPEQLVEDFKYQSQAGFTSSYLSSDGSMKNRNIGAYDLPDLYKKLGITNIGELQRFFIPVQPPGSMRTDSPMFYVWNTEMLDKIK